MKNHEERMTKQVREVTSENKKNFEELKQAKSQISDFTRRLTNYEKDKQLLTVRTKIIIDLLK